jgi:hypothetical protein
MASVVRFSLRLGIGQEPIGPLLHYLAFRPWEDRGQQYTRAFDTGWIQELRAFCPEDEEWLSVVATPRSTW